MQNCYIFHFTLKGTFGIRFIEVFAHASITARANSKKPPYMHDKCNVSLTVTLLDRMQKSILQIDDFAQTIYLCHHLTLFGTIFPQFAPVVLLFCACGILVAHSIILRAIDFRLTSPGI